MKDCKDYKDILTGLFAKIQDWKEETPTAGTRYRLAGLLADTLEVGQMLQQEVLERVSQEPVLDAGVLKGSYNFVARQLDIGADNSATMAKYLGMGKKQPYSSWIMEYVTH